ncbi:hypothetical protein ASD45_10935 [Pseudolabrys sp. Root1462]|uniref:hypothetical protein n=1 Tax=Pseudolabrys sp. Root1462 TaxID=1736466 RepID=UPI000703C15B|nr:hypothetical protein [Pseudolabrys sp. Root1462]KQZ01310.1 hypothetical protein ASD45_10935 [Pseudolabrys sp. Root1462]
MFIRLSEHEAYRIPLTYRPRWSGGSGRYLALQMVPPEFTPAASASGRHRDEVFIQWNSVWLTSLLQTPSSTAGQRQDSAYGLTRQVLGKAHTRYVDNSGAGVTLIDCYGGDNSNEPSCQHQFLDGPRHIAFRHRTEDVPNWRALEANLTARLGSFRAATAPIPPSSRP